MIKWIKSMFFDICPIHDIPRVKYGYYQEKSYCPECVTDPE